MTKYSKSAEKATARATSMSNIGSDDATSGAIDIMPWRPAYLRRRVLFAFVVLFGILIIAIEVLLSSSTKQDGLATSNASLHYLWTFGPTAFLTFIAALWARVEYQAKASAPWIRLNQSSSARSRQWSMSLDYVSMWQPRSIWTGIRNRDLAVVGTTVVSLLFTAMIVLSTGLITLTLTSMQASLPFTLTSTFIDSNLDLQSANSLPFFTMLGVDSGNITYPSGTSQHFAYQTFNTSETQSGLLNITLDGFSAGMACEQADLDLDIVAGDTVANFTLTTANCTLTIPVETSAWQINFALGPRPVFAFFQGAGCGSSSAMEDQRVALFAMQLNCSSMNMPTLMMNPGQYISIIESTQMICAPTYNISRVDVVQNGTEIQSITLAASPQSRWLKTVNAWNLMQAHLATFAISTDAYSSNNQDTGPASIVAGWGPYNASGSLIQADGPSRLALQYANQTLDLRDVLDPQTLESMATDYYQHFAVFLSHTLLTGPAKIEGNASAIVSRNRLLVQPFASHSTTALLVACILTALLISASAPKSGFMQRGPGSVLSDAAILRTERYQSDSRPASERGKFDDDTHEDLVSKHSPLSGPETGGRSSQDQKQPLWTSQEILMDQQQSLASRKRRKNRNLQPMFLRPLIRSVILFVSICVIVLLQYTLKRSDANSGLATVGDDTWQHYSWTTLPALISSGLLMALSSVDFELRKLTSFFNMLRPALRQKTVSLELLDGLGPILAVRELLSGSTAALGSTVALQVGSLLTIFVSSLFYLQTIPSSEIAVLHTSTSFADWQMITVDNGQGINDDQNTPTALSLVFWGNDSYPAWTYEDLAFPSFSLEMANTTTVAQDTLDESPIQVKATVPALTTNLTCRAYESADLIVSFYYSGNATYPQTLYITIAEEQGCVPYVNATSMYFTTPSPGSTIAWSNTGVAGCSSFISIWGIMPTSKQYPVAADVQLSGLACNETIEIVDTDVTFTGLELSVATSTPPVVNPVSSRPAAFRYPIQDDPSVDPGLGYVNAVMNVYTLLSTYSTPWFTPFMSALTTSQWAIPVSSLLDASQADQVREAIKSQFRIGRALTLSLAQRQPASQSNTTLTPSGVTSAKYPNDAALTYSANVTNPAGQRRLVQDPASTRALQGLLGVAVIASMLAWILMPRTRILAGSPTQIESVAKLIAGGNLLEYLPENAAEMCDEELHRLMPYNARFWMGWGVYESEPEIKRFGIWVMDAEMAEDVSVRQGSRFSKGR